MKKLLIAVCLLFTIDGLHAQSSFYQGKTLRIIVGYLPGDNHDLWARAYGRFMGKHIPEPRLRCPKYARSRIHDRC
jgi:tripartite-type tricarboxylate transporter receptor subunit TctC